jgi:hypothetical protein
MMPLTYPHAFSLKKKKKKMPTHKVNAQHLLKFGNLFVGHLI